jgi:hypothetical protein
MKHQVIKKKNTSLHIIINQKIYPLFYNENIHAKSEPQQVEAKTPTKPFFCDNS